MILISFALALIAIVFGAKLLAQSQKENLGALYKYLAWFVIAMGFCVLMCDGAKALLNCCRMRNGGMMRKEMMMRDGGGMMGGGPMWMRHGNDGGMSCGNDPCCKMMMNQCCGNNNCCDGMMNCHDGNNNCSDGNMNSHDGKGGMGACCPMMGNMKGKADSTKPGK